jgi:hypothetical protein
MLTFALQERRDAWRLKGTGVSYGDQSAQLKDIRPAHRFNSAGWAQFVEHAARDILRAGLAHLAATPAA